MTPTELHERLDRLADAHVADLETPLPIAASGGTRPNRTRLVLVAAAVAVLAGSWFLVRTAGDDGEESPAVRVETLGEPQLNLPAWTELPITDPEDVDPAIADLLFDSERTDLDPTTLRTLGLGESTRYVGLSADHSSIFFGVPIPSVGGLSSGGAPGSLLLINDNLVRWQSQGSAIESTQAQFGVVPQRLGSVLWDEEPIDVSDGTLFAVRPVDDSMQAGGSGSLTTLDGDPLFMIPTVGEPGSFVRGQVLIEGARVDVDADSAICLRTPTGLRAAARHRTSSGVLIIGLSPEGASAQVVDDDTFLIGNAAEEEVVVSELGGDRFRAEINGEDLSGEVEIQCINPPTLEMLVAAMRGED